MAIVWVLWIFAVDGTLYTQVRDSPTFEDQRTCNNYAQKINDGKDSVFAVGAGYKMACAPTLK